MALLWMDGFDHYGGTGVAVGNMLDGAYAEIGTANVSTIQARTGTFSFRSASSTNPVWRRVLPGPRLVVGFGGAFWLDELPSGNNALYLVGFNNAANTRQVSIIVQSTGVIAANRGGTAGTNLGTSTTQMTAAAWNHIEVRVVIDATVGAVEVRLNGVTILDLTGVNTLQAGDPECSQIEVMGVTGGGGTGFARYIDDVYCWDDQGDANNDFLGDLRVRALLPDGDTVVADWVRNTGSADYAAIAEMIPDDDATYLESAAIDDVSEFEVETPPPEVSGIVAVQSYARMRKTEAGDARVQVSMRSGGDVGDGADRPVTEEWTYWTDVFEVDPATGAPWTPAALGDALLRLTRTV